MGPVCVRVRARVRVCVRVRVCACVCVHKYCRQTHNISSDLVVQASTFKSLFRGHGRDSRPV